MKKWMIGACLILASGMCTLAVKPSVQKTDVKPGNAARAVQAEMTQPAVQSAWDNKGAKKEKSQTALKRMFKFQKKLYVDTGETASGARCGVMDGQITSSVSADKIPKKNGQSNFGSGYGIQYGRRENLMEVQIDGVWHVFAYNENNFDGVSMQVVKISPSKATLEMKNSTDLQVQYGDDFQLERLKKKTGEWDIIPMKEGYAFHDIAYPVKKDVVSKWKVNWGKSNGKLKPGTYRIIKKFHDFRGTGDYTVYTLSAQFRVRAK